MEDDQTGSSHEHGAINDSVESVMTSQLAAHRNDVTVVRAASAGHEIASIPDTASFSELSTMLVHSTFTVVC